MTATKPLAETAPLDRIAQSGAPQPLNATTYPAGERPRVRIVHLGLGAFHRAHQVWYTEQAHDGWGIASFTGRSPEAAEVLSAQDGLYTLVERGPVEDRSTIITHLVEAHDGADLTTLATLMAQAEVGIVTLTITEAGYRLRPGNTELDVDDEQVAADVAALCQNYESTHFTLGHGFDGRKVRTAPARLVVGLAARRAADGWPIAIVPCDNLPSNGTAAKAAVVGIAELVDPLLANWISENVSFVDTSIDRITPRTTDEDRQAVAEATGYDDASPVITEPFSSWVLAGEFPGGRPAWENAGAVIVEDLEAFERRKLWLLNGSHSLMAYAGALRGHATVAAALADAKVSEWVEQFWDAAANHLQDPALDVDGYRAALRERFNNPRIAHYLAQIGMDGSLKLAARALPVFAAERAAGRDGTAALRPIAAWMDRVTEQVTAGEAVKDPAAPRIAIAAGNDEQTRSLLAVIDENLAADDAVVAALKSLRGTFKD